MKKAFPLFIILLLFLSSFLFLKIAFAVEGNGGDGGGEQEEEEEECFPCPCGGYYYCTGGCDGELHYVTPGEPCCGGIACEDILVEDCSPWQMCDAGSVSCYCQGQCLETPTGPRYYDNATYSDQPGKDYGNKDIYLPVKLDWDDVEGWGQADGPQSYVINISNTNKGSFPEILGKSEYIPSSCV